MDSETLRLERRRGAVKAIKLGLLGLITSVSIIVLIDVFGGSNAAEAEKQRIRALGIPITMEEYRLMVPKPGSASKYLAVSRDIRESWTRVRDVVEYECGSPEPIRSYTAYGRALAYKQFFRKLPNAVHEIPNRDGISAQDDWMVTNTLWVLAIAAGYLAPFDAEGTCELLDLFRIVRDDLMQDAVIDRFGLEAALVRCYQVVAIVLDQHPSDLAVHERIGGILSALKPDDERLVAGSRIIDEETMFHAKVAGTYPYAPMCEPEPTMALRAYRSGLARHDFDYRRWRIARLAAEGWVDTTLSESELERKTAEIQELLFPTSPLEWKGRLYQDFQVHIGEAISFGKEIAARRNVANAMLWLSSQRATTGAMPSHLPAEDGFMDPYVQRPLVFKVIDGKIFVYSVGPDGIDESSAQTELKPKGDDIAISRKAFP